MGIQESYHDCFGRILIERSSALLLARMGVSESSVVLGTPGCEAAGLGGVEGDRPRSPAADNRELYAVFLLVQF